jgi:hypothetical protein
MSGPREKALCHMVFRRVRVFASGSCKMHGVRRVLARFEKPLFYRLFPHAGGSVDAEQGGRFRGPSLMPSTLRHRGIS